VRYCQQYSGRVPWGHTDEAVNGPTSTLLGERRQIRPDFFLHDRLSAADFLAVLFPSEDLIEFLPPHKSVADLLSPESREMELLAKLDGRIKFELEGRFAAPPNVVRSRARPRSPPSAYPTRTRSPSRSRDPQIAHASRVAP
jgi:hypothetical protein